MTLEAQSHVSLRPYNTLRAGGAAERLAIARSVDELADWAAHAFRAQTPCTVLGWGSNVLPSDAGVPGLVIVNQARTIRIQSDGAIEVDSGFAFQELFLKAAQAGLKGLEYAVGIPGAVGGGLVSNAGAYRSSISESLVAIEVVAYGERKWVEPSFLKLSYRDSVLRSENPPPICLLKLRLQLEKGDPKTIYDEARDYQRQRIGKQPPQASAGSFFKNVYDKALCERLETLRPDLREAGVAPAGHLIEAVGLKGFEHRGAAFGRKHANFILNLRGASATSIRSLAQFAREKVRDRFGVELEEEALYLGDWSGFVAEPVG